MTLFSMKTVLRQTGLKADTLRAWEKRYQAVVPTRLGNGRRAYSETEVARLKLLCDLVSAGQSIGSIARLPNPELIQLSTANQSHQIKNPFADFGSEHVSLLIQALENFDIKQIKIELAKLRYLISPQNFVVQLVPQIMFLVGQKIAQNKISVSQEHALSDIVKNHIVEIYDSIEAVDGTKSPQELLLFTTREGDIHNLGILIISTFCRFKGFKTHYLGTNMPADSLNDAVKKLKPNAVVIGLSYLPTEDEKISPQKYLETLDQILPPTTGIWCGGSAINETKRPKTTREFLIFESMGAFEEKLRLRK